MANMDFGSMKESLQKTLVVRSRRNLLIVLGALTVVITALCMYFGLMPINIADGGFRMYLVGIALLWAVPLLFTIDKNKPSRRVPKKVKAEKIESVKRMKVLSGWGAPLFIAGGLIVVYLLISLFVSPLFMSKSYRDLIYVQESGSFNDSMENYDTMQIPVVDNLLADKLGDKKLGEGNYGSQYQIDAGDYTMIVYNGHLYWVAPIEYSGFFKWSSQPSSPGFIKINATDASDVVIVDKPLKYLDSAYFWDDLQRQIYFSNMFRLREGKPHLELDEQGTPFFIEPVLTNRFAFFGGTDSVGVIVTDAYTGISNYYDTADCPEWIDRTQPESLISEQLGGWGTYVHGFFNSLFAKKEVLEVSSGLNYIYTNGHMYLQTGMTSVGSDESIVGVQQVDMRTKKSTFYRVGGATELAASQSAIATQQAERYTSTAPIIINFNTIPTYFMMLKGDDGLVKRYAYVNVADYRIVAVHQDINQALLDYEMKINPNKVVTDQELIVTKVDTLVVNGNTLYYLKFSAYADAPEGFDKVFFEVNPSTVGLAVLDVEVGDTVKCEFIMSSSKNTIIKLKITEKA